MRISQLMHVMGKDERIVVDDYNAPIDNMTVYEGTVRGIKRDDPINQMHILSICAINDVVFAIAEKPNGGRKHEEIR